MTDDDEVANAPGPRVLNEEQTRYVHETLQRYFDPRTDEDRALFLAVRFVCALSTAKELIPMVASCLEAANGMMAGEDRSARVMHLGINVFMSLSSLQDERLLAVAEEKLQDLAEMLNEAMRPQGSVS